MNVYILHIKCMKVDPQRVSEDKWWQTWDPELLLRLLIAGASEESHYRVLCRFVLWFFRFLEQIDVRFSILKIYPTKHIYYQNRNIINGLKRKSILFYFQKLEVHVCSCISDFVWRDGPLTCCVDCRGWLELVELGCEATGAPMKSPNSPSKSLEPPVEFCWLLLTAGVSKYTAAFETKFKLSKYIYMYHSY